MMTTTMNDDDDDDDESGRCQIKIFTSVSMSVDRYMHVCYYTKCHDKSAKISLPF